MPVGGLAVILFGTVWMPFPPLHYRPALAKFEYEPTHPFATILLWGWLGGGWVSACVVRCVGGVLSAK